MAQQYFYVNCQTDVIHVTLIATAVQSGRTDANASCLQRDQCVHHLSNYKVLSLPQ